ncbi:bi-domain-containing oxidoreductase [Paraburkholderia sartisoli]|uniref:Predicted dehydrogenase n=1 Tax=Paraburkholderia sartisoli TaxID=83784 RepID=A0A1H4CPM0_9BURK|nr:bi-domain-containing oxidoreductase [Paraburkholderia sartisoli]SEA62361.1 Predicted dehydrogenase [Paraburkholderia sartisoli]
MKQILQNMGNGQTSLVEAPAPRALPGTLLIRTTHSLISAGTERMLVDFGKASMIDKARQQPEKVKMVLDKVKTEGLMTTIDAVRSKLDQPLPLGYCNVGVVLEVGAGVSGFAVGDRVASNGPHADLVRVPKNLCATVPVEVDSEAAAFTVLASIGLQGIRLVQPTLGEYVVVTGLGLIGLATVQLLRAHGCQVLGIDFDESKLALARKFGAQTCNPAAGEDPVSVATAFSQGRGIDAVVITASTKSSEPVSQAAQMCRKRGRIVLVGVTGLELNRSEFYEKELSFQVSCSYGPGRYDAAYEQGGQDYPLGFVRWTEQRNFEAVLAMMQSGRLDVAPLISHRYGLEQAVDAYRVLTDDRSALGIVLQYPDTPEATLRVGKVALGAAPAPQADPKSPVLGVIGAGNYASRVLLPAFARAGAVFDTIVTSAGVSGVHHGKKLGFRSAATDRSSVLQASDINTVIIATRHDTHARFSVEALRAGKHVFVEKPLALTHSEIDDIERTYREMRTAGAPLLMVGFNRRFSPLVQRVKQLLDVVHVPKVFIYTVSAGAIPADHWTQDMAVGGGRIIGEACHFVDLLRYLTGAKVVDASIRTIGGGDAAGIKSDKAVINLTFEDGSLGTIHYLANGGKAFPKERLEVFANDGVLQLDNYRSLQGFDWPMRRVKLWKQDKGQDACAMAFLDAIKQGKPAPIPFEELIEVARLSVELATQAS